jgi:N-glycosylase/DNA lyase
MLRQVSTCRKVDIEIHMTRCSIGPLGESYLVRVLPGASRCVRPDRISFICSSNNNIGRITKMVQALCTHYSPPLLSLSDPCDPSIQVQYYPFPPPSVLAAPDVGSTLRTLGFGYRADFIQRTAKILIDTHGTGDLAEVFLASLRDVSTENAREELLKFVGVGRKVADCVLLMSLDKVCCLSV